VLDDKKAFLFAVVGFSSLRVHAVSAVRADAPTLFYSALMAKDSRRDRTRPSRSDPLEAALQIGDEVVRVFQTDVKADDFAVSRHRCRRPHETMTADDREALEAAPGIAETEMIEAVEQHRRIGLVRVFQHEGK